MRSPNQIWNHCDTRRSCVSELMRFLSSRAKRKAGVKIRVQQQPMKLLEILLERPGEVITREELRGRVWADESFGDFDQAVNIAVRRLG